MLKNSIAFNSQTTVLSLILKTTKLNEIFTYFCIIDISMKYLSKKY